MIYAMPVSVINPDDTACRARIAPERLEQLDRRRGTARAQGFAATMLLEYAVARHFPSVVHPLVISQTEDGKPYLVAEPQIHFSLSHSGDWAVCAISDHPVGVDIERCVPGRSGVAARYFHREEAKYIALLRPALQDDAFYSLWTLKESFVKSIGRGLTLPMRRFCIDIRRQPVLLEGPADEPCTLFLPEFADPEYRLAVCVCQADAPAPEVFTASAAG